MERFRSDAKAEGELVVIGGYETFTEDGYPVPHDEARWFMLTLDRRSALWAFQKGEPFRTIASLEMLGSLLSLMLLVDARPSCTSYRQGSVLSAAAITDNASRLPSC